MSYSCIYGGPCTGCLDCKDDVPDFKQWYCVVCLDGWNNASKDFKEKHEKECPTCKSENIEEIEPDKGDLV